MASLGAWAYKAKHNDVLIMCFGVNDILRGFSAEQVIWNLEHMVSYFQKAGVRLVVQTLPPFDYNEAVTAIWKQVNGYILTELARKVELVFDVTQVLSLSPQEPQRAKYGGHPNEEGCRVWADALYEKIMEAGILE